MRYEILPQRSLVRVMYSKHPSYPEWEQMMMTIFVDPQFQAGFNFIFDKRAAGEAASTGYVEAAARFHTQHQDKMGRCAIVVEGLLAFGMSRMTEAFCPVDRVRAFEDMQAAEAWLDGLASPDDYKR